MRSPCVNQAKTFALVRAKRFYWYALTAFCVQLPYRREIQVKAAVKIIFSSRRFFKYELHSSK